MPVLLRGRGRWQWLVQVSQSNVGEVEERHTGMEVKVECNDMNGGRWVGSQ